jgi:predicted amidophosphoribosyltransferase
VKKLFKIRVCCSCGEEIERIGAGDEIWDFCPGCRNIEGETKEVEVDQNGNEAS